jgi:hypothetical protein
MVSYLQSDLQLISITGLDFNYLLIIKIPILLLVNALSRNIDEFGQQTYL